MRKVSYLCTLFIWQRNRNTTLWAKKQKYYVVWQGHTPGIYDNWADCQKQVVGVAHAQYKSYNSLHEAEAALRMPYSTAIAIAKNNTPSTTGSPSPSNKTSVRARCLSRRRCLQRQPWCHGIPRSLHSHPTATLPLQDSSRHQQHWRIPRHRPRPCLPQATQHAPNTIQRLGQCHQLGTSQRMPHQTAPHSPDCRTLEHHPSCRSMATKQLLHYRNTQMGHRTLG